jgi:Uma2 family endonuclease
LATDTATYVTPEEYLAAERDAANTKHEWIDGETREMTGAKHAHIVIVGNVLALVHGRLKGRSFVPYSNDMKVRIPNEPFYYYPDIAIAPDPPEFEDGHEDIILNPLVVVEVLSPSTEEIDRSEKLDNYRRIPSLVDYLLVEQDECRIDHYSRLADGRWPLAVHRDPGAVVRLDAIGCQLVLREVYDRVLDAGA